MKNYIHETSIVDNNVNIGNNTKIWQWCHISENVIIGESCNIGQNVFIDKNVNIGKNAKIQNNVSIFKEVNIGDNVFCGPSVVFTNVINPRSEFEKKDQFKKTFIENGVTLGANSTIICGITINEYAFVGAGSLVNRNVQKFSLVVGNPAKHIGWYSRYGEKIPLPLNGKGKWLCSKTNDIYVLNENKIEIINES